jgi:hypothetical protein
MPMSDTLPAEDPTLTKTAKKRGRPSTYSVEIADVIFERMIEGETLTEICSDKAMPGRRTVFQWLEKHPEFARKYAIARWSQIDWLLEETVEIAETEPDLARARLMIDTRFGMVGRLWPRKYW